MARTGPVTKDTTTVALGLAQIRVGLAATYIGSTVPRLQAADSLGALANTKFSGNVEYYRLESGFPLLEDAIYPLREAAALECAFKELTPKNVAIARGLSPATFSAAHVGSIPLGVIAAPTAIRVEAIYTFPDGTNVMGIIFPRANAAAAIEMEFAAEEPAAVAIRLEAKRADSEVSGGNAVWDNMPYGRMLWDTGGTTWTTTTTTTTA
jgi:hypothetical protein